MCITDVQPSPPGAQLWPRGNRCGQPALPDVRFGCGGKESPGAPEDPLAPDSLRTPLTPSSPPVYTSLDQGFPLLTGSLLLLVKSAGVYIFR